MQIKYKYTVLITFCLLCSSYAAAQVKKTSAKPSPAPAPKIESPTVVNEATTTDGKKVVLKSDGTWSYTKEESAPLKPREEMPVRKLPVPFTADDVKEVMTFLGKDELILRKSEYETEQEYSSRLSKIQYETASTKKLLTDIAFIFPLKQEFNAESEIFSFDLYNSLNYRAFSTLQLVHRRGNEYRTYEPSFYFKMPREQAKSVGYKLQVAVFGYPVKIDKRYKDDPKLLFYLKRIAVFNKETGEIYYDQENFEPVYSPLPL
ncbi:MAG TPA: hypothetical protein VK308_14765 [Pyrinomonadaceae bacterium]|nr:hypothetical protein [Pyrinomonadaceae bacterium]